MKIATIKHLIKRPTLANWTFMLDYLRRTQKDLSYIERILLLCKSEIHRFRANHPGSQHIKADRKRIKVRIPGLGIGKKDVFPNPQDIIQRYPGPWDLTKEYFFSFSKLATSPRWLFSIIHRH